MGEEDDWAWVSLLRLFVCGMWNDVRPRNYDPRTVKICLFVCFVSFPFFLDFFRVFPDHT